MASVIRLKRRLCDEPLEALVVNCKRQKRDNETNDSEKEIKTVLKFAGTVKEQNEDFSPVINKISKSELESSFKKHTPEVTLKNRQEFSESSKNSRFKIVNLSRSINQDKESSTNTDEEKIVAVLDIESEGSEKEDKSDNFVYDLYYTNSDGFGECLDEEKAKNYLRVLPAGAELVYDDYRGNFDDSDNSSEDSNAENNWRNDYPDEDEYSINDFDMVTAVNDLDIEDERELSSDDGEEGFVYSIDSEAAGFEEDLDDTDVRRYGEMYARFKARQKREEEKYNKDIYSDDVDDTEEDFYD